LAQTNVDILTGVPGTTLNRLLNVATVSDNSPACDSVATNQVTVNNDQSSFIANTGATPIADFGGDVTPDTTTFTSYSGGVRCVAFGGFRYQSSNNRLVVLSGRFTLTFDTPVSSVGFNAYLKGAQATVTVKTASGQTSIVNLTADGYVGLDSIEGITEIISKGASGLELSDFVSSTTATEPTGLVSVDTATSSSNFSVHPPSAAIDGVLSNNNGYVWISLHTDSAPSLTLDMGSPQAINFYRLSKAYCDGPYAPGKWEVLGSNDQTNWTTVDSVVDEQASILNITGCGAFSPYYQIDSPGAYQYYQYRFVTTPNGWGYTGVGVGEIELWN
jgi:hypothetical protein